MPESGEGILKKFLNDPHSLVGEALEGFAAAYPDLVRVHYEPLYVARAESPCGPKVALVSGGGSGHEPLHVGFVGPGMLDAACPGEVFSSPTPDQIAAAAAAVDNGAGVLLLVKNYDGDIMNFDMAAAMMATPPASVTMTDDVALGTDPRLTFGRRGVAGTVVVEKIVGALAAAGGDLEACRTLAERINAATCSIGVALTSCTVPGVGAPMFPLDEDAHEFAVGIHGEPGRQRQPMATADRIADSMMAAILAELPQTTDRRVLLLTNGFGATPLIELYLMHGLATRILAAHGYELVRSLVGNYCTSFDRAGCSFTVTLLDDELCRLWDAPARTPALVQG